MGPCHGTLAFRATEYPAAETRSPGHRRPVRIRSRASPAAISSSDHGEHGNVDVNGVLSSYLVTAQRRRVDVPSEVDDGEHQRIHPDFG